MSKKKKRTKQDVQDSGTDRRAFLTNVFMGTGLVTSHVFAAGLAVRYLYPTSKDNKQRLFVGLRSEIPPGSAFAYEGPGGRTVNIVRGSSGFVALSDVCPHLGCRVHWESANEEFVCPCHDGHFDATGAPVSGPPAEMGSGLPKYNVIEEGDMIFLEMSIA